MKNVRLILAVILLLVIAVNVFSEEFVSKTISVNSDVKGEIAILGLDEQKLTPGNGGGNGIGAAFTMATTFVVKDYLFNNVETKLFEFFDELLALSWKKAREKAEELFQKFYNFLRKKYFNAEVSGNYKVDKK
ncbi:MAG: hypothetical protein H0Z22_01180 [Thermosipho sp. (in: Bacteria)]|nr:hypothetical protein [Thermosipho sp. (in: thermotogales)]